MLRLITGIRGATGFGSASTAEEVTDGVDATALTVIITGFTYFLSFQFVYLSFDRTLRIDLC